MQTRLQIVKSLNTKMINNFQEINDLAPIIYDELATAKKKEIAFNSFENKIAIIYDILLEYATKIMNLQNDKFTLEWLKANTSDDNSYILADEAELDDELIVVPVYERDSYIQEEYINTILNLQELVLTKAKFYDLFDFYNKDIKNIIGCAKILMYHTEDLEDLALMAERNIDNNDNSGLKTLQEVLSELKKKED